MKKKATLQNNKKNTNTRIKKKRDLMKKHKHITSTHRRHKMNTKCRDAGKVRIGKTHTFSNTSDEDVTVRKELCERGLELLDEKACALCGVL